MEVKVKQDTGRKNLGKICLCLQIQFIGKTVQNVAKGGVMTTEMTNYDNFNTRLYKERRKDLSTEQNSEEISKIVFSEEVLGSGK
jgi:hypothetical protein